MGHNSGHNSGLVGGVDITALRERLGLSQEGLAERLGVSQAAVSQWEAGRRVPGAGVLVLLRGLAGGEGRPTRRLDPYPCAPVDPAGRRAWVDARNRAIREGAFEDVGDGVYKRAAGR